MKNLQNKCNHVVGHIGIFSDPLVKLVLQADLAGINTQSSDLKAKGFEVTLFPHCPVCGKKLLNGTYKLSDEKSVQE